MILSRALFSVLAGVALLSVAFAADEASDVIKLTKDNFDDVIAKEKLVLVKFFAPWCGHCQAMAEDFKSAATELKGQAVLGDVDATVEEELAKKYNIDGFPTLKVFADGEELTDYNGGRDKESMIKFIHRATLPSYVEIADKDAYKKFVADNKGKNLLVAADLDDATMATFKKATFSLRDVMPDAIEFAYGASASSIEIDGIAKGEIYLLRLESDGSHRAMKFDSAGEHPIEKFVKTAALPVFQEFTQENAELYTELSIPLVVGFYKDCEGDECKALEKVARAKADSGKLAFAWVNSVTLESFQEYVGLKDAKVPICAYAFESDARYILPEGFEFSEEGLTAWVDDLIAGKLKAARKSQPIPEEQDEPVFQVVGDSWADEVEKSGKDVFIAQVAEWCGHCAALKPIMKKVAEELKKAGIDHVRIAQMDATENDAPDDYKAKGFPTVYYFKAGSGKGVSYEGERTSKGIIDWLKENTSKKFEFDTDSLGEDPKPEEQEGGDEEMEGEEGEEGEEGFDDDEFGEDDEIEDDGADVEEGDDFDEEDMPEEEDAPEEEEKEDL